jgi:hypothetical protein
MRHLLFEYQKEGVNLSFKFATEDKDVLITHMKIFADLLSQAFKDVTKAIEEIEKQC